MAVLQRFARVFLYIIAALFGLFVVFPWVLHLFGDMVTHPTQAGEIFSYYVNDGINCIVVWIMQNIIPAAAVGSLIYFGFFKKAGGGGGGHH